MNKHQLLNYKACFRKFQVPSNAVKNQIYIQLIWKITNVPINPVIFSTFDEKVFLASPKSAILIRGISVDFSILNSSNKLCNFFINNHHRRQNIKFPSINLPLPPSYCFVYRNCSISPIFVYTEFFFSRYNLPPPFCIYRNFSIYNPPPPFPKSSKSIYSYFNDFKSLWIIGGLTLCR